MILGSHVSVAVPLVTLIVYLMVVPSLLPCATQLVGAAGWIDHPGWSLRTIPVPATKVHPLVVMRQGTERAGGAPVRSIGSSLTQILNAPDAEPHFHVDDGGFAPAAMT